MTLQSRWPNAPRVLLGAFAIFTLAAVAGYASFGLHPSLLARSAGAASAYGLALRVFPVGQVWFAFVVLGLYLSMRAGTRWLLAFVLLYSLSLVSELAGTGYGIPFGPYHYSSMLGPEWMGRVPVLIPLSWFSMSVAAYGVAPRSTRYAQYDAAIRIGIASLLLLCWDLSLDPAMSHATTYWVWGTGGPYYGMPWSNLAGWYITGVVLATALWATGASKWTQRLSRRWLAWFFGVNVFLALGMDVAAGLWVAGVATVLALLITWSGIVLVARRDAAYAHEETSSHRLGVA